MANILIVDDDQIICDWISKSITQLGHKPVCVHTIKDGLKKVQTASFDIVFLDVCLPDGNGLDIMSKIKATRYSPEIIVITALGDPDEAERALQNEAWDYIEKPARQETLKLPIIRALEYRAEKKSGESTMVLKRKGIIGSSPKINSCLELLSQSADSNVNVLISGETGTGKELFAKAIHYNSPRAKKNFVIVDCTALPETLIQSVLFGHVRGAFTGADRSQEGLIKQADGGTLFLDEIGELPLSIQVSFLRVIQEHRFRPVGGREEIASDFRLVAATNRNLANMVQEGRFREDLFFRLRAIVIDLPPLREMLDDVEELTLFYMNALCERFEIEPKKFSPEFWDVVIGYQWPGNVRELVHALEKALLSAKEEPMLFPKHLPTYIRIQVARKSFPKKPAGFGILENETGVPSGPAPLKEIRKAAVSGAEQNYIHDLISSVGGNANKAFPISGLSRSRFYTLLRKYRRPSKS
jgi:two-component system NtrC family response regulator